MGDQIAGAMVNHEGAQDPRGNESSMGRFTFAPPKGAAKRWTVSKAEFIPQWFDPRAGRVVGLGEPAEHLREVRDRIRGVVLSRGAAQAGLVMGK